MLLTASVKFIEINPRFGGGCPLSIQAGYPFPQWAVEMASGAGVISPASRPGGRADDAALR